MAMGAWVSQAVYVAAKLGIADVLSDGPKSCDEIAAVTRTPSPSLSRLLRALRSLGVIGAIEGGKFALTALGRGAGTPSVVHTSQRDTSNAESTSAISTSNTSRASTNRPMS